MLSAEEAVEKVITGMVNFIDGITMGVEEKAFNSRLILGYIICFKSYVKGIVLEEHKSDLGRVAGLMDCKRRKSCQKYLAENFSDLLYLISSLCR